jgi:hypothetical protein
VTVSQTKSTPDAAAGPFRKPRADLYTALLILALLAILVATVVLYWETSDYPAPSFKGTTPVSMQVSPTCPSGSLALDREIASPASLG